MGSAERAAACARVLKRCGLEDRARQVVGTLSKGYRQRVGLAQAILHEPQILILDEPTSGLDPNQIIEIRALIRELGERKTVLLSTHILSEVKATCDRVIIIHAGKIVADGPTESVMRMDQGERIDLVLAPGDVRLDPEQITAGVLAIDGVLDAIPQVGAQLGEGECALQIRAEGDLRSALFSYAVDSGLVLLEMHRQSSNLEDVFRRLTHGEAEVGLAEKEPGQEAETQGED
jgi:ABC-2 type transport system ATP-binding protein